MLNLWGGGGVEGMLVKSRSPHLGVVVIYFSGIASFFYTLIYKDFDFSHINDPVSKYYCVTIS